MAGSSYGDKQLFIYREENIESFRAIPIRQELFGLLVGSTTIYANNGNSILAMTLSCVVKNS
jgi:hypothetical protein